MPEQLNTVFGEYVIKQGIESKILIETIESIFTDESHIDLLNKYLKVAYSIDKQIIPIDNEPDYNQFETAYNGYFVDKYIKQLTKTHINEKYIMSDSILDIESDNSLAYASLLQIDVYIVNNRMKFIKTNATVNSVNLSIIIILKRII